MSTPSGRRRPSWVTAGLIILLLLNALLTARMGDWVGRAAQLPQPPPVWAVRAVSLDSGPLMARLISVYLQSFESQPGRIALPSELDSDRLRGWLGVALALDGRSEYPLLLASHVYAEVADVARSRAMMELVYAEFLKDPNRRWRYLWQVALLAKHRHHDLALALRYAATLAEKTAPDQVPGWARQMRIFLLAEMGEREAAEILLGGLLSSGELQDPDERRFLAEKLQALRATGGD